MANSRIHHTHLKQAEQIGVVLEPAEIGVKATCIVAVILAVLSAAGAIYWEYIQLRNERGVMDGY